MTDLPNVVSTPWILIAVAVFQVKHLLADFILQTTWMAHGKEKATGWVAPLTVHAGVHGVSAAIIFYVLAPGFIWLGLVDFVVHFAIDRGKANLTRMCDADSTQSAFWWLIGLDQALHHLTHLGFALVIAIAHTAR